MASTNRVGAKIVLTGALAVAAGLAAAAPAIAQAGTHNGSTVATTGDPRRDTLLKLTRPITLDVTDNRLEDVITFIKDFSGAPLEPMWADDVHADGLAKDKPITLKVSNASVLNVLERVMALASDGDINANSWQLAPTGECQLGPKERLNKFRRVEIYDINDLLMELPEYADVPTIDLQSVLQSGRGGGGGRSPFRNDQDDRRDMQRRERQEKIDEIIDIIQQIVEPEQWFGTGGTGASIRAWQGTLIVNAPDYVHRQLNGYTFWPRRQTSYSMAGGRRYVAFGTDTGTSTIDGFANQEVSAVVGGKIIRSGPGGGR